MNKREKIEYLRLLDEKIRRNKQRRLQRLYQALYDWQRKFVKATSEHTSSALMASNQCVAGYTPVKGTDLQLRPLVDILSLPDVSVLGWADGCEHAVDSYAAYFQGILPTYRLYLSNGHHLDCSGEHKVLTAEESYRTILSLMCDVSAGRWYQITEGCLANCDEDGYLCDQLPHPEVDTGRSSPPLSSDARQHSLQVFLHKDEEGQTDQYSQAFQSCDLRSTPDALSQLLALDDMFSCCDDGPSAQLMTQLRLTSEQLCAEEAFYPLLNGANDLYRSDGYYGQGSNHILLAYPIPLMNDVDIIAFQEIGLRPLFDLSVPDFNNYITSGAISHNCGKSRTGCVIDAYHMLGDYPDDWEGHRFDAPPLCWLLGFSGEKTRDLLQHKLVGRLANGELEGGYIPKDRIIDYRSMTGTPGAVREVRVKHKTGVSTCQFWSYSQGQHALMGDVVDWYHIDEEPEDHEIYPQVITRTLNGDRGHGGRGILTFTPENGKTELVCQFMDTPGPSDYLQGATWDECPHITPEKREAFLSKYPKYQRDMRSKGTPLMGSGLIFEVDEDDIKIDPFNIPPYWFVINGMDFGWDHPQAHIQLVWDRDNDIFYVTNAWKESKKQPFEAWHVVKHWAEGVPTAWPRDGLQHKGSAREQASQYADEGWSILGDFAEWEGGGNSVWLGITELNRLMSTGKLKIFSNLHPLFEEIRQYHTKTTAKGLIEIVKIKDDLIDALRYAYMMHRFAVRIADIYQENYGLERRVAPHDGY